eukprot:NODE_221_length_13987_cov_0.244888.p5 type:complete len:205 gc:universal NODE_221_length_13987_cov_0.244888:10134-10748(+)
MRNEKNSKFIRVATIKKEFDVSDTQLRKWAEAGKVEYIKTPGGNGLYSSKDIKHLFGHVEEEKKSYVYCRVSSQHQKEDLERQVLYMQEQCPGTEIIKDVGSGVNFKRHGFARLLKLVQENAVEKITIADKDRLCRFGYGLFEDVCRYHGTEIVVLNEIENDPDRELADDLLTICNVFVATKNGRRAARNKKERTKALRENCQE